MPVNLDFLLEGALRNQSLYKIKKNYSDSGHTLPSKYNDQLFSKVISDIQDFKNRYSV